MATEGHETRELVNLMNEQRITAVVARAGAMRAPDVADVIHRD